MMRDDDDDDDIFIDDAAERRVRWELSLISHFPYQIQGVYIIYYICITQRSIGATLRGGGGVEIPAEDDACIGCRLTATPSNVSYIGRHGHDA